MFIVQSYRDTDCAGKSGRALHPHPFIEFVDDNTFVDKAWGLCALFDVNYQPAGMTVAQLQERMRWLTTRLHSAECTDQRRRPFFAHAP